MKDNCYIIQVDGEGKIANKYVVLTPINGTVKKLSLTEDRKEATALSFEDCELYLKQLEENFTKNYHQKIKKIKIDIK